MRMHNDMEHHTRKRVLIFIVAYNAEKTIADVLQRIVIDTERYEVEILMIDDASHDATFEHAQREKSSDLPYTLTILKNPQNQGYGGNQKLGYYYAIQHHFDIVVLLHGDGQYAPEYLNTLVDAMIEQRADAIFGSRMMKHGAALKGGMPLYKFWGNIVLTFLQNTLLKTRFSEFHSGYRVYAVPMLARIPFEYNSSDFHFDTQIIIQLLAMRATIVEIPIPTYYGDEICYVNGMQYAWNVLKTTLAYRLHQTGIFYQRMYDMDPRAKYSPKLTYASSHSYAIAAVPQGAVVSDIACGTGAVARVLHTEKQCVVHGIDTYRPDDCSPFQTFSCCDLDRDPLPDNIAESDYVLLLDVLEHLKEPDNLLQQIRATCAPHRTTIIGSVPNVAFLPVRLMLLLGYFHYGKEGILDKTHTRLFTCQSLRRMLQENGFQVEQMTGVPAPFPKAFGDRRFARILVSLNRLAIHLRKELFAYQIFVRARPLPTCPYLLRQSMEFSVETRRGASLRPHVNINARA